MHHAVFLPSVPRTTPPNVFAMQLSTIILLESQIMEPINTKSCELWVCSDTHYCLS